MDYIIKVELKKDKGTYYSRTAITKETLQDAIDFVLESLKVNFDPSVYTISNIDYEEDSSWSKRNKTKKTYKGSTAKYK
jgi:hypothetical protein